jgi:hypothetical protein
LLAAAQRARNLNLPNLLSLAVRADRTIKGRNPGDPWDVLALLVARLAGARALADAA